MSQEYSSVRKRAVEIALQEVAKNVREDKGPNQGTHIDKYFKWSYAHTDSEMDWCGMFVNYCFRVAAEEYGKIVPWWTWSRTTFWKGSTVKQWAYSNPDLLVSYPIYAGDIYVMNKGHIGMVRATTAEGSSIIYTIDGNQSTFTSGRISLKTRTRNMADVNCVIRI